MRLWSLHPKYLDVRGLTACWREALLARKVLGGTTAGYRNHPQLMRFREQPYPVEAVDGYLHAVCDEAEHRGYRFDRSKLGPPCAEALLTVTDGQLRYEQEHLLRKLERRDPERCGLLRGVSAPEPHPLFRLTQGGIEHWEKV